MTWKHYATAAAGLIVSQRLVGDAAPLVLLVVNVLAIVAVRVGVRRHGPADRLTWTLITASLGMYLAGNFTLYVCSELLGIDAYPGPADTVYIAQYGTLVAALVRIVRARTGHSGDRYAALDSIVIAAGAALVGWQFWLADQLAEGVTWPTGGVIVVYALLDLTVFTLAMRALVGQGSKPVALRYFTAAMLLLFVTDSIYGWQVARGTYQVSNWLDTLWLGCFLLVGIAALHPSMVAMTRNPGADAARSRASRWPLVAMACAAALAPAMVFAHGLEHDDLTETVVALVAVVMFGGVIARAHLTGRDLLLANNALRATEHERTQLLAGVISAGEKERMWVAAELHDGPIQQLSAIGFGLDRVHRRLVAGDTLAGADSLDRTRDELTQVVSDLRQLMSELRPPVLDESGLEGALSDYVASFRREARIDCRLEVSLGGHRLPADVETTLYRVAQEALQNVRRHSDARNTLVSVLLEDATIRMRVADNGRGFDTSKRPASNQTAHYGLIGMRERVEQRGGTWKVNSRIGEGTTIDAEFPVPPTHPTLVEIAS